MTLFTVGHSTRSLDEFVDLIMQVGIDLLVDVRSFPGSRMVPWTNKEKLPAELDECGIDYAHLPALGGRRRKSDLDPGVNAGWRHASFGNYADYMQTQAFSIGQGILAGFAHQRRVVIMCSEAVPWRCHRQLLSDAMVMGYGLAVTHLISPTNVTQHLPGRWGPHPRLSSERTITYPKETEASYERVH